MNTVSRNEMEMIDGLAKVAITGVLTGKSDQKHMSDIATDAYRLAFEMILARRSAFPNEEL